MELHAVGGLQTQPIDSISERIAALGFNCVRLPFSVSLVAHNPPVPAKALAANPQFVNLSAVQLLDETVASISRAGLLTLLNNHNRCTPPPPPACARGSRTIPLFVVLPYARLVAPPKGLLFRPRSQRARVVL